MAADMQWNLFSTQSNSYVNWIEEGTGSTSYPPIQSVIKDESQSRVHIGMCVKSV